MLVRIIKNWKTPNIFRQTPNNSKLWNGVEFSEDPNLEYDYIIVCNFLHEDTQVTCPPDNIWAVMQEPFLRGTFDWMTDKHHYYSKVFTHHIFSKNSKYLFSHPALPWHVNKSYDELISMDVPSKEKYISWITSNKATFPGHKDRLQFLSNSQHDASLEIDLFGKGIQFIEDKWDGLAPYKYSIAVENSKSPNYWTEKVFDCFLSFTLPFYYGAENLEKYFPEDSFIRIDISKPQESIQIMKQAILNNEWKKRLDAIKVARERLLNEYQFFPYFANIINEQDSSYKTKKRQVLKKYQNSILRKAQNAPKKLREVLSKKN